MLIGRCAKLLFTDLCSKYSYIMPVASTLRLQSRIVIIFFGSFCQIDGLPIVFGFALKSLASSILTSRALGVINGQ